jgi:hypothetical protein
MTDNDWFYQRKFHTQPREIIRESGHRIVLMWCIALAVPSKVDRYDMMGTTEKLSL